MASRRDGSVGRGTSALHRLVGFSKSVASLEDIVACALLVLVTVLLLAQVVSRFVAAIPIYWSEEIARLGLVWVSLIGAGYVTAKGTHLVIVTIAELFPRWMQSVLKYSAEAIVVASSVVMAGACLDLTFSFSDITLTASGLPRSLLFVGGVLGFTLIAFHSVINIVELATSGSGSAKEAGE